MKTFMNQDFLLNSETAKTLFHDYAKQMPIIDYHCHINPQEIATDRTFTTITQLWLGADHYKWRLMRSNGVPEKYITGDASDFEKFEKWAETLQKAIGNPLYHWSHLELQRYFNITAPLTKENAAEIYAACNFMLSTPEFSARNIIRRSGVKIICTTDDPADSLEWHKKIADDSSFNVRVLPAWRPDRAMNLEKADYTDYLLTLEAASGIPIHSFADLKTALSARQMYFDRLGCRVSDHGISTACCTPASDDELETIFSKRLAGEQITTVEEQKFKTAFLLFAGREYHRLGWVMQLHYGTKRDNNTLQYRRIGADTGYDCINQTSCAAELTNFLDALNATGQLPKTVLYSLNPTDNAAIGTILGCFQDSSAVGKLQQGSAWWFNDNKTGMTEQMISLANLGLLSNFIGMLTDSRSFLSYTRHEYFRRILCNLIGNWVENGEYPADIPFLGQMVQDISYYNCERYFGF